MPWSIFSRRAEKKNRSDDTNRRQQLEKEDVTVRTQFLRNISHTIDTDMIHRLTRSSDKFRKVSDQCTIPSFVKTMFDVGEEYGIMLENILKYYDSVNGNFTRVDGPMLIRNIVSDATGDAKRQMRRVSTIIPLVDVDIRPNVPISEMIGDGPIIKESLEELVFNALRHDENNHVSVAVCAVRQDPYVIEFSVKNTGRQIANADMKNIFQPFQNIGREVVGGDGVGLGLARCKRMADELGGDLVVRNGCDTTISLTTPLTHQKEIRLQPEGGMTISYRRDEEERGRMGTDVGDSFPLGEISKTYSRPSALIVDDSSVARLQLERIMDHVDIAVDSCDGPLKCLDMAQNKFYDVICLDIIMVGMTGITCAKHLRAGDGVNKKTPIILITADASADTRRLCSSIVDSVVVVKPVKRSVILRTIMSCITNESSLEWIRRAWYDED